MANYFQDELRKRNLANYIPTMEKIIAARESGVSLMEETPQCPCWKETSCLNDDVAKYIHMGINLINPTDEPGGYLKVDNWQHKVMDTIRIYFCPLCGRKL